MLLNTMLWPDEVREPDFAFLREPPPQVRPQELDLAGSLIDSLSEQAFDPARLLGTSVRGPRYQRAGQRVGDDAVLGSRAHQQSHPGPVAPATVRSAG
jgi:hypothetical protein